MVEIIFEGGKIQVGDRVKIPKPIMDTLGIKEGQKISLRFNPTKREIIIKETKTRKK